jgi:ribosomal-protein-alanine N-acetyltransferase
MKHPIRLVQLAHGGVPAEDLGSLPEVAIEMCTATALLYRRVGFNPPWVGYLTLSGSEVLGTCSFTSRPKRGKVEIAYFTFPPFERRGFATAMAQALIELAGKADREIQVTARTLPVPNASNGILRKLGFEWFGVVEHPGEGKFWEWRRPVDEFSGFIDRDLA